MSEVLTYLASVTFHETMSAGPVKASVIGNFGKSLHSPSIGPTSLTLLHRELRYSEQHDLLRKRFYNVLSQACGTGEVGLIAFFFLRLWDRQQIRLVNLSASWGHKPDSSEQ